MTRIRHPKEPSSGPLLKKFLQDNPSRTRADWHDVLSQLHRNYPTFKMQLDSQGKIIIMLPKGGKP